MVHFLLFGFGAGRGFRTALAIVISIGNNFTTMWPMPNIPNGFVKDAFEVALREGRTFKILVRSDLLGDGQGLLVRDGLHLSLPKGLCCRGIISQIELRTNKDDGNIGSMVLDLRVPLHERSVERLLSCERTAADRGLLSTFALTLSNEGGLTMEKQMRKTSV